MRETYNLKGVDRNRDLAEFLPIRGLLFIFLFHIIELLFVMFSLVL